MLDYELEQLIKEALKNYRGNYKVVVSISSGGTVEIEDYDADPLIMGNDELNDKILELEQDIQSLEDRIRELEEDRYWED